MAKEVCLIAAGVSYEGLASGPLPFAYSGNTLGIPEGDYLLLRNCANLIRIGKQFGVHSYSGPMPYPWEASYGHCLCGGHKTKLKAV